MVKGRNEPACVVHVAHAVAKIKGLAVEEVCEAYVSLVANYGLELTFPACGTILSICSDLEYCFQTRPRRECRRVYWYCMLSWRPRTAMIGIQNPVMETQVNRLT
jgi:hypothetical protein